VTVLDAEEGVQSQSETVWRQATSTKSPYLLRQQNDKLGADFKHTLKDVEEKLGARTAIVTYPSVPKTPLRVWMLLEEQSVIWRDETGAKYTLRNPPDMKDEIAKERAKLIEQICETDDALLEKYLEGVIPSVPELKKALRGRTIAYKLVPMYCGTSLGTKCSASFGRHCRLPPVSSGRSSRRRQEARHDEVIVRRPDVSAPLPAYLQNSG